MKLSKEELKQKINDLSIDDDVKITLLEDVEDSFEASEDNGEELTELNAKYDELKEKYKNRFLTGKDDKQNDEESKEDEELKEEDIVEEKDIFKEEED